MGVVAVAEWYRYRTVACLVTSSSPVPLKTRRVGQRCMLNLSRAETPSRWCGGSLVTFVEGEERLEAPDHPQGVLSQNWGGTEQNHTVTCMLFKAKANDRRKNLVLRRDEFRGPRSDVTVDRVA
ncbi:uncharacterized protein TNCV_1900141 [Trichonephila clavipes]|nr:uncharacterized protein TNCV_1900141 [Trichonephila clavipes]